MNSAYPETIEKEELINFLPHEGKMFLLTRMTSRCYEPFSVTVETDISEDFIFYEEELEGIPNWCTFEIMAQAISALTGVYNAEKNIKPKAGCILSVSNFSSNREIFKKGTIIKASAQEEFRDEESNIYRYACQIYDENSMEPAVQATITVMQTEDMESIVGA